MRKARTSARSCGAVEAPQHRPEARSRPDDCDHSQDPRGGRHSWPSRRALARCWLVRCVPLFGLVAVVPKSCFCDVPHDATSSVPATTVGECAGPEGAAPLQRDAQPLRGRARGQPLLCRGGGGDDRTPLPSVVPRTRGPVEQAGGDRGRPARGGGWGGVWWGVCQSRKPRFVVAVQGNNSSAHHLKPPFFASKTGKSRLKGARSARNATKEIAPPAPPAVGPCSRPVALLPARSNSDKTKRSFLTTTRSQPRLGLVARCGDLAL